MAAIGLTVELIPRTFIRDRAVNVKCAGRHVSLVIHQPHDISPEGLLGSLLLAS